MLEPILQGFLDKWVYPTGFSGPGAEFRLKETERFVPVWNDVVIGALHKVREAVSSDNDNWKRNGALGGYSGEGPHMSIKQMSTQLLSVSIPEQAKYIDLQRMRARQVWDEVKHGSLHADVLLRGGWIKKETELLDEPRAANQGDPAYFGLTAMAPHIHPLSRAGQHYLEEGVACLRIISTLSVVEDPITRHENYSQLIEEMMHFIEGKYQIDAYALTPEDQAPVKAVFDYLLRPWGRSAAHAKEAEHAKK